MSSSKRHFTAVIGKKEQGSYTSSSPSSAARKAVSKLCADDKNRKVEFYMRETTQSSEKKVYGMYMGYMEKLKKPIELKGRVIRYKPVAKLLKNKKMKGGSSYKIYYYWYTDTDTDQGKIYKEKLRKKFEGIFTPDEEKKNNNPDYYITQNEPKKKMSKRFLITDEGIEISDNFPNFEKVQAKIKQAFEDLSIHYEHDTTTNEEEM